MIMRISSFLYCIKQGLKNIWRHKIYTLASLATMSACIFMFGVFFCLVQNVTHMVKLAEQGVAVTVFFEENMSESDITAIGERISTRTEVSQIEYVSATQAWEEYKETYFDLTKTTFSKFITEEVTRQLEGKTSELLDEYFDYLFKNNIEVGQIFTGLGLENGAANP